MILVGAVPSMPSRISASLEIFLGASSTSSSPGPFTNARCRVPRCVPVRATCVVDAPTRTPTPKLDAGLSRHTSAARRATVLIARGRPSEERSEEEGHDRRLVESLSRDST